MPMRVASRDVSRSDLATSGARSLSISSVAAPHSGDIGVYTACSSISTRSPMPNDSADSPPHSPNKTDTTGVFSPTMMSMSSETDSANPASSCSMPNAGPGASTSITSGILNRSASFATRCALRKPDTGTPPRSNSASPYSSVKEISGVWSGSS